MVLLLFNVYQKDQILLIDISISKFFRLRSILIKQPSRSSTLWKHSHRRTFPRWTSRWWSSWRTEATGEPLMGLTQFLSERAKYSECSRRKTRWVWRENPSCSCLLPAGGQKQVNNYHCTMPTKALKTNTFFQPISGGQNHLNSYHTIECRLKIPLLYAKKSLIFFCWVGYYNW